MLSLFDQGTHRVIAAFLDRVQAYRLHHVDKHFCSLLHRLLCSHEQGREDWERIGMRLAEWERISPYEWDRVLGRVTLVPPSPDSLEAFSDIDDP